MENSPLEGKKNPASTILDIMEDSVARSYFFFILFKQHLIQLKKLTGHSPSFNVMMQQLTSFAPGSCFVNRVYMVHVGSRNRMTGLL